MKRRIASTLLMASLLGAYPLRAAGWVPAPAVRVEVRSARPEQVQALCAAAKAAAGRVRVVSQGRACFLEVTAGAQADLARALARLRRAADAAGVKLRVRSGAAAGEVKAVSWRPVAVGQPDRAAGRTVSAAVLDPPPRPAAPCRMRAQPPGTHGPEQLPAPAVRAPRGPPHGR